MNKLDGRQREFGELIRPLFEHLPEIPVGDWHRFSFDVVQLQSGVQVAHIRFQEIAGLRAVGETIAQANGFPDG